MILKEATVGLILVATSVCSSALSLERAHGAAWIGRPLELAVSAQIDAGVAPADLCAEADVFQGDNKMDPARIRVSVEPTDQPTVVNLRIYSSTDVEEPVVTVYLRLGCSQKVTRRYVLLADYPSEVLPPIAREAVAPVVTVPVLTAPEAPPTAAVVEPVATEGQTLAIAPPAATPAAAPPAAVAPAPKPVPKPVQKSVPKPVQKPASAAVSADKPTPKATPVAVATKPPEAAGRARLKLDPQEPLLERIRVLEAMTSGVSQEEMARESQRVLQMQMDFTTLQAQVAKNEAAMKAMREAMEKKEAESAPMGVVYGLIALVLLCMGAMVWLWSRRTGLPSQQVAFQPNFETPATRQPVVVAERAPQVAQVAQTGVSKVGETPDVDVNLTAMDDETFRAFTSPMPLSAKPVDVDSGPDSMPMPFEDSGLASHDFNTEEMLDLLQQAEFFVKLGKADQAIETLEKRIRVNAVDSPLLYLELLRIANTNNLKTDFRQFREEFQTAFNARVPEFALFKADGKVLEAYPEVMQKIAQSWNSPRALGVIEGCILRNSWGNDSGPFDLAAFKELVLLHGIAMKRMLQPSGTATPPGTLAQNDSQHVDLDF